VTCGATATLWTMCWAILRRMTGGTEEALTRAREAARGKDVTLAGGASAAQQYLKAGLVDEMELHLVPVAGPRTSGPTFSRSA
jgi:dihydrofolate reductase